MAERLTTSVTVVIPARNAAATLPYQLASLDRQSYPRPFTVIVVDNASTDRTADVAQAHRPVGFDLRLASESRLGINRARNAGVAAAEDGVILLCDADDICHVDWVEQTLKALVPGHWVAGTLDYVRLNSVATREMWDVGETSAWPDQDPFVDRTVGANCAFHRSMWAELGGFDERLSGRGDENEFFMRAFAAGYRPIVAPAAVVSYRLRSTSRGFIRQRWSQGRYQVAIPRISDAYATTAASVNEQALEILRTAVAFPKYARGRRSRFLWLGSMSRRLGRLTETVRPSLTTQAGSLQP